MKAAVIVLAIAIAAIVGIELLQRQRQATTTTTTTAKPTGTGPAPVKNASGENITALNWLDTSDNAAALARMQADPTDQEWFNVMDANGNPTGNITLETLAQATAGASAAAKTVTDDNAARLAQIAALNKLSAVIGMKPLAMTATDQQVATYRASYLNNPNLPDNRADVSLGWLGAGLNVIGGLVGAPKLGTGIQATAALST